MLHLEKHSNDPLRIIIGAGEQSYDGWIPTHIEQLDLKSEQCWIKSFKNKKADAFLSEHVWEHLTLEEGIKAAKYVYNSLNDGGYIRVAVPDKFFPNQEYQIAVQIGGPGPTGHPAYDHKIVYDYKTLTTVFKKAGFKVDLLEYCDESGRFHYNQWDVSRGSIYRSLLNDHRNKNGMLEFVSIIIDAKK